MSFKLEKPDSNSLVLKALLLACLLPLNFVFASTGSLRTHPNLDVLYIASGAVDIELRRKLFHEAKHSIDVILFSQALDEVGAPLTQDLRASLNAGIDVHVIYDGVATGIEDGDFKQESAHLLTDAALEKQAEVIAPGIFAKFKRHLSLDDFIHEKIVIIDRGTPDVKILIGGRNHSHTALEFKDSTFLLRPIDPQQTWAGADLENYYETVWEAYSKIFHKIRITNPSEKSLAKVEGVFDSFLKADSDQKEFQNLTKVLAHAPVQPGADSPELNPIEFQPQSFQLSSNDLIVHAAELAEDHVMGRGFLGSANLNLIASFLPNTKSLYLSAYGMGFPKEIKEAFLEFTQDPTKKLTIITNSPAAYLKIVKPSGIQQALARTASNYTVTNLIPFLRQSEENGANNVTVYRSSPASAPDDLDAAFYLHHKFMVLDDKVVVGSDNFTYSSAFRNSEIIAVMQDSRLAHFLTHQVHTNLETRYSPLTLEEAESEVEEHHWYHWLLKGIIKQTL